MDLSVRDDSRLRRVDSAPLWTFTLAAVTLLSLLTLLVWSATDACFGFAHWQAGVSFYLRKTPSLDPETTQALGLDDAIRAIHWNSLGKRAIGIAALYGVGILSTVGVVILIVLRPNAKRLVVTTLVLIAWAALVTTRTQVEEWRTRRQVSTILPRFEQAAEALTEHWPTQTGEVPPGVRFYASERYPDVLMLHGRGKGYPTFEDFGLTIRKGPDGIIRFDLASNPESTVEYHPNATRPSAYVSGEGYPSPPVASVTELKPTWYLVRYGQP